MDRKKRGLIALVSLIIFVSGALLIHANNTLAEKNNDISQHVKIVDWNINDKDENVSLNISIDKTDEITCSDLISLDIPDKLQQYLVNGEEQPLQNLFYNDENIGSWQINNDKLLIFFGSKIEDLKVNKISDLNIKAPFVKVDKEEPTEEDKEVSKETDKEEPTEEDKEVSKETDKEDSKEVYKEDSKEIDKEVSKETNNDDDKKVGKEVVKPEQFNIKPTANLIDPVGQYPPKYAGGTNNATSDWYMYYNFDGLHQTLPSYGKPPIRFSDSMIVDTVNGQVQASQVTIKIAGSTPTTLDTATAKAGPVFGFDLAAGNTFGLIPQPPGMSQSAYESVVTSNSTPCYGLYYDSTSNKTTVYVNFKNVGNNGFKYPTQSNVIEGWVISWYNTYYQQYEAMYPGYTEAQIKAALTDWYNYAYGPNNNTNGNILTYLFELKGINNDISNAYNDYKQSNTVYTTEDANYNLSSASAYTATTTVPGTNGEATITYNNLEDGTNASSNPSKYLVNVGVGGFAPATRTGYEFAGWFNNPQFTGSPITYILPSPPTTTNKNIQLYAKWTANTYNINYDFDGGNNISNPSTYTYGVGLTFTDPAKYGYKFTGWVDANNNPITSIGPTQQGEVSVKATWELGVYTISYELYGGVLPPGESNPTSYTFGDEITSLFEPTISGKVFVAWLNAEYIQVKSPYVKSDQAGDVKFIAFYAPYSHFIRYETQCDGATTNPKNPQVYTYGYAIPELYPITCPGNTFNGWFNQPTGGDLLTSMPADYNSENNDYAIYLYAQWTTSSYDISYEMNGGTNNSNNVSTYEYGQNGGNIALQTPTKTGYTFAGWYTDASLTGTPVTGINTKVENNQTFYAAWNINTYNITYNNMVLGGVDVNNGDNPKNYVYEANNGSIPLVDVSQIGYTFNGWYDNPSFTGSAITTIDTTVPNNQNIYANWTPNTYTVTYELNGGGVVSNPTSYEFNQASGNIALIAPLKTGYTFGGWFDNSAFTGTAIDDLDVSIANDQAFYAKWSANTYTVTYDLDGGTNSTANPSSYEFDQASGNITLGDATKTGYAFAGWYDNSSFSNNPVTEINVTIANNQTLYAKFEANKYTITYDLNGGSEPTSNPDSYYYDQAGGNIILAEPIKEGYTFTGWFSYLGSDAQITEINVTSGLNYSLYAKWKANEYTITYNLNDGDNNANNPTSYYYDQAGGNITLQSATKVGYNFEGWYDNASFTGTAITEINVTNASDYNLYAKFDIASYPIIWNYGGGTLPSGETNPTSYTYGIGIDTPFVVPTMTGNSLIRWIDGDNKPITNISPTQTGPVYIYAQWSPNSYSIDYKLGSLDAQNNISNPPIFTYGQGVSSFADPIRTGYTFDGWYDDASFTNQVSDIATTVANNITLYAKWSADTFTVTYDVAGGTNGSNPASYTYQQASGNITLEPATKTGYTFDGWYDNAAFNGSSVTIIDVNVASNQSFYAKFTPNYYTVTYNLDDGINGHNPVGYTYDQASDNITLAPATKTGYVFNGWYDNAAFTGTVVTEVNVTDANNQTLYAKFSAITYTITYNLDNGTNGSNPSNYTYNQSSGNITLEPATKTGYTFNGWYQNASFSGNAINVIDVNVANDQAVYAKFTINTYDITYELDGGTLENANPSQYTYNQSSIASLNDPTKTGYTFEGWYDAATNGNQITAIDTSITNNQTLYAHWSANQYTIQYNLNYGSVTGYNPTTYTYGVPIASFAPASKPGYEFVGWFDAAQGGTQFTGISATQTGNLTLWAIFKGDVFNITYNLNDGVNDSNNPATFTEGVGVNQLQPATKTGYTFVGWFEQETGGTTAITNIAPNHIGDVTLYAYWQANQYTITYDLNGGTLTGTNPNTYAYGIGVSSFVSPTKDGYDFAGWYDALQGGTKVDSITTTDIGNKALYAIWFVDEFDPSTNENNTGGIPDPNKPGTDIPFVPGDNGINVVKPGYEVACGTNPYDTTGIVSSIEQANPEVIVSANISNNMLTITLEPKPGFVFSPNQQTEIKYQLPQISPCKVIPSIPAPGTSGSNGGLIPDPNKPGTGVPFVPGTGENAGVNVIKPGFTLGCGDKPFDVNSIIASVAKANPSVNVTGSIQGNILTITFSPKAGYVFNPSQQTEFKYQLPTIKACTIIPEVVAPGISDGNSGLIPDPNNPGKGIPFVPGKNGINVIKPGYHLACGDKGFDVNSIIKSLMGTIKGMNYTATIKNNILTITISPKDGYALAPGQQTVFKYQLPKIEPCNSSSSSSSTQHSLPTTGNNDLYYTLSIVLLGLSLGIPYTLRLRNTK